MKYMRYTIFSLFLMLNITATQPNYTGIFQLALIVNAAQEVQNLTDAQSRISPKKKFTPQPVVYIPKKQNRNPKIHR